MKDKAVIELTAKEAQIITSLLPTVPIRGELNAAANIMKLKLEVDEILGKIKRAFGDDPPQMVEDKPRRKRH